MSQPMSLFRRKFLQKSVSLATGLVLLSPSPKVHAEEPEEDVSPAEDLMREHGLLKRILLIYEEAIRRIDDNVDLPPQPLKDSAMIIRSFIENYHEKLEEDFLFPRFRKANKHVRLVEILLKQHQAGRVLTDQTIHLSTLQSLKKEDDRHALKVSLHQFIRMYSPHEAREDTVLFPALREIITANEYDSLGEDFEDKEHDLFGEEGFEKMVDKVAAIEKSLGIYDLDLFTPKV